MTGKEADERPRRSGIFSRLLWLALFLAAGVVVVQTIAPQTIGEQARRHVLKTLQEHYPQFDVSLGRGRYSPSVGLIFEDLRITDPSALADSTAWGFKTRKTCEILSIRKLTIVADTNAKMVLESKSPLVTRRVVVEGLAAQTWLQSDGKLSLAQLWPLPVMGPAAPRVEVRGAKVRMIDLAGNAAPIDVDLSNVLLVNQSEQPSAGYDAQQSAGHSAMQTVSLRGTSNLFGAFAMQARGSHDGFRVTGKIDDAHIGPALLGSLPSHLSESLQAARGLDCLCNLVLDLHHQPQAGPGGTPKTDYRLTASIRQGRFDHVSLPQSITDLSGKLVCQPSGLSVQGMQGRCGGAICRITDGSIDQYQWPEAAKFNGSITGLILNEQLARSIPPSMRQGWDNLQPSGQIDVANANVFYRDGRWVTDAIVDCKGVDIRYVKFPYPIEQLVGRIAIRDSIAVAQSINGRIAGRRLQCEFQMPIRRDIVGEKYFRIATYGPIAIDATLLRALTPRGESTSKLETFVRSLNAGGSVHLTKAIFGTDQSGRTHREIDFHVADAHLQYNQFSYPIYNVSGDVKVVGDEVRLQGFTGTNANAGHVACDGLYRLPVKQPAANSQLAGISMPPVLQPFPATEGLPSQTAGLQLNFQARNVPMDESLRASLPPAAQSTWDAISPSGLLDELQVIVTQSKPGAAIALNVTGTEIESEQTDNRTLSIQPTSLPYRLDIADAHINYDGKRVAIDSLRTRHGATRISAKGGCEQDDRGRWKLSLGIESGSRIAPDAELIAALPIELRSAMYQLQLRRPVSVRGPVNLYFADQFHPDPTMDWDVVLQLEGNRIGDVGPVHDLRGELSAKGVYDERGVRAQGDIRIDSMHVDELQITRIQGPYSVVGEKLRLGIDPQTMMQTKLQSDKTIPPQRAAQLSPAAFVGNRKIRGRLFGGEVELSGDVVLTSGEFDVSLALNSGRVPELLAELGKGHSEMTGMINGQAELEGILGTTDLLKGVGSARVIEANLYQLPLLVQLLNLLRIKATEDVAFTDADVEFSLIEDEIVFNDLKLWGDLVALQGGGTLDRRRELDLTFNTQVSPHNAVTHILRPLRKQNYTLWTVDVRGPLDNPTVHRRSLDGVGQTLERILPRMTGR